MGWMIWGESPKKNKGFLSFPKCSDRLWNPLIFLLSGYWVSLLGVNRLVLEVNHWLPRLWMCRNVPLLPLYAFVTRARTTLLYRLKIKHVTASVLSSRLWTYTSFKTVMTLAFPLHLLPYFPSLYVSSCVTTPTDSLSAHLKFISLLCSLLSSPSVGSLYFAPFRPSSSSLPLYSDSESLDIIILSIYGICVFYALSLGKTAPWHDCGFTVNREKTYETGMGDMKIHTKYW
jgi:hypothetical protein